MTNRFKKIKEKRTADPKVSIRKDDIWQVLKNVVAFIIFPPMTFYFLEAYTHNIFKTMYPQLIWYNFLFFWLLAGLLFFLTGKLKTALKIETIFFGVSGLANFYVYRFRSNPILPWDIYSLKTAASVSGNYDYKLTGDTIQVILVFIVMAVAEHFICDFAWKDIQAKRKKIIIRVTGALVCCISLFVYSRALWQDEFVSKMWIYDKLFTPDTMQYKDGDVVAFIMEMEYFNVQKPSGYSADAARKLLAEQETAAASDQTTADNEKPNIIVIMNEAFSDPGILTDFKTDEDYLPYVHSLQNGADNTVTGTLDVSVLGGNTANTEFEFLTGDTMAFLTAGSIPYQQYIHRDIPSVVSDLKAQGYTTVAMHPYRATGWNRNKVYPYMGFDKMLFQENFINPTYIRDYVSDQSCVDMIEYEYKSKKEGTPLFLFNVTMQNHGGYTKSSANFEPDVTVQGVDDYATLSYISLIKKSDAALKSLTDFFSKEKEKTIIVMFGDHQPSDSVVEPLLNLNGKSCATLTEQENYDRYKVPLIIWANYDIQEAKDVELSANYLSGYVMKTAGVQLSDYQTFLEKQQKAYPVMSAERITDAKGTSYEKDAADDTLSKDMNQYKILQYYSLFGWKKDN